MGVKVVRVGFFFLRGGRKIGGWFFSYVGSEVGREEGVCVERGFFRFFVFEMYVCCLIWSVFYNVCLF